MNSSFDDQNSVLLRENIKLKEQIEIKNRELDKLEHVLLANLAHKEQEIADLSAQIEDMKASSNPCNQQLRCMGLDPAVNAVFLRIKKDMKAANEKLEQTQNDLQAWKFTPDSQTGKRMMTRMRVLLQENEELGKINQSGRTAKLESEIAMKRTLIEELKQTNSEYENVIDEMDTETDCFQTSIFMLQQQLEIARTTISTLCADIDQHTPGHSQEILTKCNWIDSYTVNQKSEPMDVIEMSSGDRDINGDIMTINRPMLVAPGETLAVRSQSIKRDTNCTTNSSLTSQSDNSVTTVIDERTRLDNNNPIKTVYTNNQKPVIDHHTKSTGSTTTTTTTAFELINLKCESVDSDSNSHHKIVNKKPQQQHSVKSNSERNQKKLTS